MQIIDRVKSPTPSFFKRIRNIGVVAAAIAAAILGSPVAMPVILVKLAGYLVVAGSIASAVSQFTTEQDGSLSADKKEGE